MCGIAGVFGKNDTQTVYRMLAQMHHRGPDDEFAVWGSDYSFGARRLSIVGIGDGRQPLSNENGSVWAAQNGELYNYPTVKKSLETRNHKFRTTCDTEILPHLYDEYGADLVHHIDGMFAVCVWDKENRRGLLARDRMGKKPLYYLQTGSSVYFASEIKCLLQIPGFQRRINPEALSNFFSFKHVPCPLTIFEGIRVLPPAHRLIFTESAEPKVERYWDLDFSNTTEYGDASEEELTKHLIDLLKEAVQRRLMSDVPIGFFLSGGIDSSLSTVIAQELNPEPIKTFTLTYADGSTTEGKDLDQKWARWTAQKYKTEHYEERVEFSDFPENLRKVVACFDEPFAGTLSTYFLSGLISKHVKVALSGDGADELFGSYLSHRLALPLSNFEKFKESADGNLIKPFENQIELLSKFHEPNDWEWRAKLLVYSDAEKRRLFSAEVSQASNFSSSERLRRDFSRLSAQDPLNRVLEAEYKTIFPDQVLAFVDRLSMAHSLEVRSAYIDTAVVEFIAGLPGHLKIRDGETKYLLKKAALNYFPPEMVFRKKEGFLMPITEWLSNDLEDYVRTTLSTDRLAKHGLFNQREVNELVDTQYQTDCDYTHVNKVFALIVFQEWYELYMESTGAQQGVQSCYDLQSNIVK